MFKNQGLKRSSFTAFEHVAEVLGLRRKDALAQCNGLLGLVVTDLESFTSLVAKLGDWEARHWIREHNRLVRELIAHTDGVEVAHTGDGMIAAFRSLQAALQCTRNIQARSTEYSQKHDQQPLRIRIGVHAGEPLPEDGRLFGTAVNTAVRVCSAAEAGQTLVTDVVRQLAQGCFGFHFAERGTQRFKGLSDELRIYELLSSRCSMARTEERANCAGPRLTQNIHLIH